MRGEFVDVSGLRLYYYAAGTRGAGDPVLLLHGFATSAHLWRQLISRVPAGHRVIAVDLAGHGRSEPIARGERTAAAHALLISRLLEELRTGAVHVVAHGFGCEVALSLAAISALRNMLLVSPAGDGERAPSLPAQNSAAALALRLPWGGPATIPLRRYLTHGYSNGSVAARSLERHLQWFREPSRRAALSRQLQEIASAPLAAADFPRLLEIVTGGDDPFTSARRIALRFPALGEGSLTVLGGERHFLPEEAPDVLARALPRLLNG